MDRQLTSPLLIESVGRPTKLSTKATYLHLQNFLDKLPASPARTQIDRLADALGVEVGAIEPSEGERREAERASARAAARAERRAKRAEAAQAELRELEEKAEEYDEVVDEKFDEKFDEEEDEGLGVNGFEGDATMDDRGDVEYGDVPDEDIDEPDHEDVDMEDDD